MHDNKGGALALAESIREKDTPIPPDASYKAQWIQAEMIINAIGDALDGEEPSDFELSFPIVRKAWDVRHEADPGLRGVWFQKGKEAEARKRNASGCACIYDDYTEAFMSICALHDSVMMLRPDQDEAEKARLEAYRTAYEQGKFDARVDDAIAEREGK